MQMRLKPYLVGIGLAAVAASTLVYLASPDASAPHARAAFCVAVIGVLAELMKYQMPQGGRGSTALVAYIGAALLAPNWASVIAVGCSQILVEVIRRRKAIKAFFNIAQAVLSIALAILAYRASGGVSVATIADFWSVAGRSALSLTVLLVVFVLTNTLTVSGVIAINQSVKLATVWSENTRGTAVYTLAAGVLAYLLAAIQIRWGIVGSALAVIPVIGFTQFYKTTLQLQQTNRELLDLMVKAIEARDPYTSGHSRRVADAATVIAKGIGLTAAQVERVRIAALLHDIGKIDEIYAPILRKEGKLTTEEWEIMKTHPIKSAELVATLSDLRDVVGPVRHHHEHWDGRGYPDGLTGEDIPLGARIITFADTMDALMTDRPYRRALSEADVRAEFVKNCGTQFDPTICGHVLSPTVWSQLFPDSVPQRVDRRRFVTPAKARTAAVV